VIHVHATSRPPSAAIANHGSACEGAHVLVVEYDPLWTVQFRSLSARLAGILRGLASSIQHVGGTAVPGMVSRPIIDIDVLLDTFASLPKVTGRLALCGHHEGFNAGSSIVRPPAGAVSYHLRLHAPHSAEFRSHLAIRNYLRRHAGEARTYGELKRSLASRYAGNPEAYRAGKHAFLEGLTQRAVARGE
jgi:GrpB-like predicted nucleotidyltransferase (UPF0157 family)